MVISDQSLHRDFVTVDQACDFLVDELKVDDNAVDQAIIALTTNSHVRAVFHKDGTFSHTEAT
jgi:hypothetical protein